MGSLLTRSPNSDRIVINIYLSNSVLALNDRQDSFHLDGRRVLVSVAINATQNFLLKSHVVKFANFQIPVRFEQFFFFLCYNRRTNTVSQVIF